jgi:hypothetical protein
MEEALHEITELRRDNKMLAVQLATTIVRASARVVAV